MDMQLCDGLGEFWLGLTRRFCAGERLGEALGAVAEELKGSGIASVAREIHQDVMNGNTLSDALKRHPDVFKKHVLCLVEGGERAGIVDKVLLLILEQSWRCPTCILTPPQK